MNCATGEARTFVQALVIVVAALAARAMMCASVRPWSFCSMP